MQGDENKGLYQKYVISKTDGTPVDEKAKYFVLRYDPYGDDPIHIEACRKALGVYAMEIKDHIPSLAMDLIEELSKLEE